MPQEKIRERVLAIACGDYKPNADDPKIWFDSVSSLQNALFDQRIGVFKQFKKHTEVDNARLNDNN